MAQLPLGVRHQPPARPLQRIRRQEPLIIGGYQVDSIAQIIIAGARSNNIIGTNGILFETTGDGGVVLSRGSGGTTSALTLMRTDWNAWATARPCSTRCACLKDLKLENATGTSDRLILDAINRKITLGAGISTANVSLHLGSGSPEGVSPANPGSEYLNYGAGIARYRKATGPGNTGWQAVGVTPVATGSRPTAAAAGVGGTVFDSTLGKPIWSDGTN